jgi:hypothetical protein
MIREVLKEELSTRKKLKESRSAAEINAEIAKLTQELRQAETAEKEAACLGKKCYVCGRVCNDVQNINQTIFGPVHEDCWGAFMDTFEWGANQVYEIAMEGNLNGFDLDPNDDEDWEEMHYYLEGWDSCFDDGLLPFSDTESEKIREKFFKILTSYTI